MNQILANPTLNNSNNQLSRLASEVSNALRSMNAGFQDISAYGAPSECGYSTIRATQRQLREILARYGQTAESFYELMAARIDGRALYMMNIDPRDVLDQPIPSWA